MNNIKFGIYVKLAILLTTLVALDICYVGYKFMDAVMNGILMPEINPVSSATLIIMVIGSWIMVAIKEKK